MKTKLLVLILVTMLSLSFVSILPVFGQDDNVIKVLSYSWYTRSSDGHFIVVGEVQNKADFTVKSITVNGKVFSKDGLNVASSSIDVYGNYLLPQTKAPFYIDFPPNSTATGDFSWNATVDHVDFSISNSFPESNKEYNDMNFIGIHGGLLNGVYMLSGFVINNGNKTAEDVRVVGTFYDSSSRVVAVGFNILDSSMSSLSPNQASGFTIIEFDPSPNLVSEIANYSLLVQTSTLTNASSSSSSSSPSSMPNNGNQTSGSFPLIYVIGIIAIIIIVIAIALLMRRKRHPS
jgi:hypothetical protein